MEWAPRYDAASELVYTVLSQHTSDVNSKRAFENLTRTLGTVDAIADAPVERIEEAIRVGGLAAVKAPRIRAMLRQILERVGSYDLSFLSEMTLAEAKEWLRKLPGVGHKTAAIILCFSLGMPAMPVDTHVFRVSGRLGLVGPKATAERAHEVLESMVAPDDVFAFHIYLIRHGRRVCKAQRPLCDRCVLSWGCPSRKLFTGPAQSGRGRSRSRG